MSTEPPVPSGDEAPDADADAASCATLDAVGEITATRWQWEAQRMHDALPATLEMLERGDLLVDQATVLLRTRHCTPEVARAVEAAVPTGSTAAASKPHPAHGRPSTHVQSFVSEVIPGEATGSCCQHDVPTSVERTFDSVPC